MVTRNSLLDSIIGDLFPPERNRSQDRRIQILEAAITSYTRDGVEKTTPGRIAKACGVSRPLVLHYFPDQEQLFEFVVKYIRARFQELAIEAIRSKTSPQEQLAAYVDSTFDWVRIYPRHAKVWLLFYYYCSIHPRQRRLHSELVTMGHRRIIALLESGEQSGIFRCADPRVAAKMIQLAITGAVLTIQTETSSVSLQELRSETLKVCQGFAGVQRI